MTSRRLAQVCLLLSVVLVACAKQRPSQHEDSTSAHDLEGRLLAPCCWVQTLDIHESELASALRTEIEQRRRRSEPSDSIEDDLAQRYGERIRAVPKGKDPRTLVPIIVGSAMLAILVGLLSLMRLWLRRSKISSAIPMEQLADEYDEQIESELALLDKL